MINCLTGVQKFFALIWAFIGFIILCLCTSLQTSIWNAVAPGFFAANSDALGFVCWAVVTFTYVGLSLSQRGKCEFIDKLYTVIIAACGNRRAEHRVMRWQTELMFRDAWGDWIARTNADQTIENISEFFAETYDVILNDPSAWQKVGAAGKHLSDRQARQILAVVARRVEISY